MVSLSKDNGTTQTVASWHKTRKKDSLKQRFNQLRIMMMCAPHLSTITLLKFSLCVSMAATILLLQQENLSV
jgi:hypothetical protein